jgi:hypothetical protein
MLLVSSMCLYFVCLSHLNIFYVSLGKLELRWSDISAHRQSLLLESLYSTMFRMSAQGLANGLYGLSKMEVTIADIDRDKLEMALQLRLQEMSAQEIANTVYA